MNMFFSVCHVLVQLIVNKCMFLHQPVLGVLYSDKWKHEETCFSAVDVDMLLPGT